MQRVPGRRRNRKAEDGLRKKRKNRVLASMRRIGLRVAVIKALPRTKAMQTQMKLTEIDGAKAFGREKVEAMLSLTG